MDTAFSLAEIKAIIRSLIVSSRDQRMVLHQLQTDFTQNEGSQIPYAKFGYQTLVDFVRSMPDVLTVHGRDHYAIVKVVTIPSIQHVEELVQMSIRKKGNNSKSRKKFNYHYTESPSSFQSHAKPQQWTPQQQNHTPRKKSPKTEQPRSENAEPATQYAKNESNQKEKLAENPARKNGDHSSSDIPYAGNQATNEKKNQTEYRERAIPYAKNQTNEKRYQTEHSERANWDHSSTDIPYIKNESNEKKNQTEYRERAIAYAKNESNQKENQAEYPERKNCDHSSSDIPYAGNQATNEKKNPTEYPERAISYAKNQTNEKSNQTEHSERKNFDHSSTEIPFTKNESNEKTNRTEYPERANCNRSRTDFPNAINQTNERKNQAEHTERTDCDHNNEWLVAFNPRCSDVDLINMLSLGKDIMHMGSTIADAVVTPFAVPNTTILVQVLHVVNPNRIWLRCLAHKQIFDRLLSEMCQEYNARTKPDWDMKSTTALPGLYCAAFWNGTWHRAKIVGPLIKGCVTLNLVDLGVIENVGLSHLKYLSNVFQKPNVLAVRASLAYLVPRRHHWSRADSDRLEEMLDKSEQFIANIVDFNVQTNVLDVVLQGPTMSNVNQTFASEVEATWVGQNYLANKDINAYRTRSRTFNEKYPTFSCIEEGHFPALSEIRSALTRNFDFEQFYAQIPHNPLVNIPQQLKLTKDRLAEILNFGKSISCNEEGERSTFV